MIDSLQSLSLTRASVHLMTFYTLNRLSHVDILTIGPAMHTEIQYTQNRKKKHLKLK